MDRAPQADPEVRVEPVGQDVLRLYAGSGMERGRLGRAAVEWTFSENPEPFAVVRLSGEIVGLSAYIGARWKMGPTTGHAYQAVDSFVSEKMRGRGLFTILARRYAEHAAASGCDIVWGFPNDNAAPAWFKKLGWVNLGQVPLMVKPLRAGYFLRKARLSLDFPISGGRDSDVPPLADLGEWADDLWQRFAAGIGCGVVRDRAFLHRRLFSGPHAAEYRVVADAEHTALVATKPAAKHGGNIAYLMEAMGGDGLQPLLRSELARLRDGGTELVLAWCFPWSPNYPALRRCGFVPVPERLRPFRIWFGARASSPAGRIGENPKSWYLSYLDSDTV